MNQTHLKQRQGTVFSMIVVLTLVSALGVHSVQVAHDHPGHAKTHHTNGDHDHGGTLLTLGEYAHMSEKKMWLLLLSTTVFGLGVIAVLSGSWSQFLGAITLHYFILFRRRLTTLTAIIDHLSLCLRLGILNPKLH